ncbi:MAG: MBOAT family protein, partial [Candidatus Omnitrophica bacterium]|nr:MBOAT family protein [Candidatus Omnitrophota bacterium]
LSTFSITVLAWVFFRAKSIKEALSYIYIMFSSLFTIPKSIPLILSLLIPFFIIVEWLQRDKQHALEFDVLKISKISRWLIYYSLIFIIFSFGGGQQEFIYFQF